MNASSRILSFAAPLAAIAALTVSTQASAADSQPVPSVTPAQPAPAAANADRPSDADAERDRKMFSVELNPLAATIGRYSVQVEWLPAAHHAVVLNPHFDHVSADVTSSGGGATLKYSENFTGFGSELGYRFYTGEKGPNGFYVGPSFLFGTYSAGVDGAPSGSSVSFTSFGAALDIGGQAVIGPGIVVGGGFGLQYTSINKDFGDLPLTAAVLAGGGVRPRFLMSVGYAF
jgi:hypothetical protein